MAKTFRTLCDCADWTDLSAPKVKTPEDIPASKDTPQVKKNEHTDHAQTGPIGLHYNIQIHLPETTNMAVYDAIFQSLKKHLF